jgi:hypothetical protein
MDDTACVVRRAIRGVREAEEEGRTGEEVGINRGVDCRWGDVPR